MVGGLLGVQEPRLQNVPEGDPRLGDMGVNFCRNAGMTLFPWQEELLRDCLRTVPNEGAPGGEDFAAREVVVPVSRQNGKGEFLVARELVGVYLLGEMEILHTAHLMDTAISAQKRLWEVIEGNDDLLYWWEDEFDDLPKLKTGNGKEGIVFPNGAEIYFRTRSHKTGRGMSVDLLLIDECFNLPAEYDAGLSALTSARARAQRIYISSPVNRMEHAHGQVFSAKRWAGIDGEDGVLFKEWSPDEDANPFVQGTWEVCNPSLVTGGVGKQLREVKSAAAAAKNSEVLREKFMVEHLGAGLWFPRDGEAVDEFVPVIDPAAWETQQRAMPAVGEAGLMALGVDTTPDGEAVSLVMAAQVGKGYYLSLAPLRDFSREPAVDAIARSVTANDPVGVVVDPTGQGGTLVTPLRERGIDPDHVNGAQVSQAWELFLRLWAEGLIQHDGDARWVRALGVAVERSKGGKFRCLERFSGDVTCLVAASLAVWQLDMFQGAAPQVEVEVERKTGFVRGASSGVVPVLAGAGSGGRWE